MKNKNPKEKVRKRYIFANQTNRATEIRETICADPDCNRVIEPRYIFCYQHFGEGKI